MAYSVRANKFDFRKVPFSKIKVFLCKISDEFQIQFKNCGRDFEFETIMIIKSASRNILGTSKTILQQKLKLLTEVAIPIDKKKDIKDLLIFLPKTDQIYFKKLI